MTETQSCLMVFWLKFETFQKPILLRAVPKVSKLPRIESIGLRGWTVSWDRIKEDRGGCNALPANKYRVLTWQAF